jgi:4,5-dihydroxyphthalate decarboxylase
MPDLVMRTAIGTYGFTEDLKNGTTTSSKFEMDHVEISPITSVFRRMVREMEFDVAEMALSTYLCALAHGKAMTGIPIFVVRSFYHGTITCSKKSGIKGPGDLAGRKVGVRGYTVTPGVWARGLLQSAYGLDLDSVTWVLSGDEHVAEYVPPANVVSSTNEDLNAMMLSGEIDAAIGAGPADSPDIVPLFPDAAGADADWFKQTGLYPISHMMVVKNDHLASHPWMPGELISMFQEAKKPYLEHLHSGGTLNPADQTVMDLSKIVGDDPLPYGVEASRKTLDAFMQMNLDQKIIPEAMTTDEVFAW